DPAKPTRRWGLGSAALGGGREPVFLAGAVEEGEDLGALGGDGDGVLEVGGAGAVAGDDGPAVVEDPGLGAALVDHGLDGQGEAGLEAEAAAGSAVVGHLGLLVHAGAD